MAYAVLFKETVSINERDKGKAIPVTGRGVP
jgi:hypothetical protein